MAVTGALVNISANVNSLSCLADSQQPAMSLALILRKASFQHLQLSTLVCQVFHNLLLHERSGFEDTVREALGDSLFELVDTAEDMINEEDEEEEEEEEREGLWDEQELEQEQQEEEEEGGGSSTRVLHRRDSKQQPAREGTETGAGTGTGTGTGTGVVSESRQRYEQFVRVGRMVLDFLMPAE